MAVINALILVATFVLAMIYIVQVNGAAEQGYRLRDVEKKTETLRTEVVSLEDKVATLSSVQGMSERAAQLGFVQVDRLEFANPASQSYAAAH